MRRPSREGLIQLTDRLRETVDEDRQTDGRTSAPRHLSGDLVRLHAAGLSTGETVAILDLLGVDRSHGVVCNWVQTLSEAQSDTPRADPSQVALDEIQIDVDGEKKWL